jgi:hypothetical protein
MSRKSPMKPTSKKPAKPKKAATQDEAERKKAILDGIQRLPGSLKAALEQLGLPKSTYYRWSQRFKADGMDGLKAGAPVSDEVWKQFVDMQKKQGDALPAKSESRVEEKRAMKSEEDKARTKELLFKRFDEGPSQKEAQTAKEAVGKPATPEARREPPYTPPPEEPMDKTLKYAIGAFALVLAILLIASFSNSNKFYFKKNEQMVEVWRGRFAPMGEVRVASFSDPKMLEGLPQQASYTKKQACGVLYDYLVGRADDILNTGQTPDLKAAKSYLTHALKYAVSDAQRRGIRMRVNSIDYLVLSQRADIALSKGTRPDFEAARAHLTEAMRFASTDLQKDVLAKRLAAIEYAIATSKINTGEQQLARLYREALNRHLKKAKQYSPEKSKEIDKEIGKIKKWLDEFDRKYVGH